MMTLERSGYWFSWGEWMLEKNVSGWKEDSRDEITEKDRKCKMYEWILGGQLCDELQRNTSISEVYIAAWKSDHGLPSRKYLTLYCMGGWLWSWITRKEYWGKLFWWVSCNFKAAQQSAAQREWKPLAGGLWRKCTLTMQPCSWWLHLQSNHEQAEAITCLV